tara:strand:+ start:421 stop:810 length:390 start_codon:yes stop_codon:yes gene_type:complete
MFPDIKNKPKYKRYIILFKREYDKFEYKHYYVKYRGPSKLQIDVNMPEDAPGKLQLVLEFDEQDNVKSIINTADPEFKNSLFYKEVLEPGRDNEAWDIIKKRYEMKYWIKKYIYFLLHAPVDIIELLKD